MSNIQDLSFNATQFHWDPSVGGSVQIRVNCLSTEFSAQKGVKGMPLRVQIDTYDDLTSSYNDSIPVHRAYCQVKSFRDKVSNLFIILLLLTLISITLLLIVIFYIYK